MRAVLSILMVSIAGLLSAGCAGPSAAARHARPVAPAEPAEVMAAYVKALHEGDMGKALEYLYTPAHFDQKDQLREMLGAISRRLQESGCEICVADFRKQTRLALVIYGSCNQEMVPQPVFLVQDRPGHWKLHDIKIAGPLQDAMKDRHDFLAARELAQWGARRMTEIAALRRVSATNPTKAEPVPGGGIL